jgi:Mg2+/Co2+ transporter CorB
MTAAGGFFSRSINAIIRGLMRATGTSLNQATLEVCGHDALHAALDAMHRDGNFDAQDRDRLSELFELKELEVSDVMRHRMAMVAVNADDPADVIVRTVLESPYTRMPVWRNSTENIIGVVHAKDLLRALLEPDTTPADVDVLKIMQKPWFVPDSTSLKDQLAAFLKRKVHFAVVVDEYGEVQGVVTLEDIMEEIVGDIADEHDIEIQGVRKEANGSIVVDGSVPIRDLNRALGWDLPDGDATTIAGLVINESKLIPEERQAFTFYGKRFIVMKREKNRITRLRIRPAEDAVPAAE